LRRAEDPGLRHARIDGFGEPPRFGTAVTPLDATDALHHVDGWFLSWIGLTASLRKAW
jgi:hypothetical protein